MAFMGDVQYFNSRIRSGIIRASVLDADNHTADGSHSLVPRHRAGGHSPGIDNSLTVNIILISLRCEVKRICCCHTTVLRYQYRCETRKVSK